MGGVDRGAGSGSIFPCFSALDGLPLAAVTSWGWGALGGEDTGGYWRSFPGLRRVNAEREGVGGARIRSGKSMFFFFLAAALNAT
jgi:hypothetical protein